MWVSQEVIRLFFLSLPSLTVRGVVSRPPVQWRGRKDRHLHPDRHGSQQNGQRWEFLFLCTHARLMLLHRWSTHCCQRCSPASDIVICNGIIAVMDDLGYFFHFHLDENRLFFNQVPFFCCWLIFVSWSVIRQLKEFKHTTKRCNFKGPVCKILVASRGKKSYSGFILT